MMDEFDNQLDSAETDPRPRWKASAKAIWERQLMGIPSAIAEEIAGPRLRELGKQLRQCFEEHRIADGNTWIAQFEIGLRNAIQNERANGRLRPVTAESELERCKYVLGNIGFRAIETDSLKAMLRPDDLPLVVITVRTIKTSSRTIGRGELIAVLRPSTQTNRSSWEGQFPGEAELAEREESAYRATHPEPPSFNNYNHDLPRPMKME